MNIKEKLIQQNERCADSETGECLYREGDLRCAVGFALTNAELSQKLDQRNAHEIYLYCPSLWDYSVHYLTKLQEIHDSKEPDEWPELLNVCEECPEPEEIHRSGFIFRESVRKWVMPDEWRKIPLNTLIRLGYSYPPILGRIGERFSHWEN